VEFNVKVVGKRGILEELKGMWFGMGRMVGKKVRAKREVVDLERRERWVKSFILGDVNILRDGMWRGRKGGCKKNFKERREQDKSLKGHGSR
jgi:hypothetical protein